MYEYAYKICWGALSLLACRYLTKTTRVVIWSKNRHPSWMELPCKLKPFSFSAKKVEFRSDIWSIVDILQRKKNTGISISPFRYIPGVKKETFIAWQPVQFCVGWLMQLKRWETFSLLTLLFKDFSQNVVVWEEQNVAGQIRLLFSGIREESMEHLAFMLSGKNWECQ